MTFDIGEQFMEHFAKLPCPFCNSTQLRITDWMDESGEYDAIECIECIECLGSAPVTIWNRRRGFNHDQQDVRRILKNHALVHYDV